MKCWQKNGPKLVVIFRYPLFLNYSSDFKLDLKNGMYQVRNVKFEFDVTLDVF